MDNTLDYKKLKEEFRQIQRELSKRLSYAKRDKYTLNTKKGQ